MPPNLPLTGVGIGLRHPHMKEIRQTKPRIPWLEVHTENFFSPGARPSEYLLELRELYPISAHCVGLSLGSACGVDPDHIQSIKAFCQRYEPSLVSDHLSWSAAPGINSHATHLPDLLPLPYTEEALKLLVKNITLVQESLGRTLLVENPSSYLTFKHSTIQEADFIAQVAERADCHILLDINNIHVSCTNHGMDPKAYLTAIPPARVKEIHLAGYREQTLGDHTILLDDHGAPVYPEVWELYKTAIMRFPETPTLIEWDTNLPALSTLLEERSRAEIIYNQSVRNAA